MQKSGKRLTGKLELTWTGKYEKQSIEPRILIEDKSKSYGDPNSGNMLIHGDNLIALKALEQDFAGKIKCIYIDPPYNTGSAFEHYDDGLEHSVWLGLIRDRMELLYKLLAKNGSIWISIDDNEQAYLKVMLDEVFGRNNFFANIVWQHSIQGKNDAKKISLHHNYILVYQRTDDFIRNTLPRTEEHNVNYRNSDNDPKGAWRSGDVRSPNLRENLKYTVTAPNGNIIQPPEKGWRWSKELFDQKVESGEILFVDNETRVLRKIYLSEQEGRIPESIWFGNEVGTTREATSELAELITQEQNFATPKPERLIERILTIATNQGDIVLDSFLGSGTTAAVAHKMDRRWIGIELGDHAYTHCKVRLDAVVDGEQGGISEAIGWQGGGGYKFYELAPSLLEKHSVLPVYQINKIYTFEMLCEAICKIEGFTYKPRGEMHGHSSERKYIHITKDFVSSSYIKKLMKGINEKKSVLIYGVKIQSKLILPDNVEVKKIPKDLLKKCDFLSEVR